MEGRRRCRRALHPEPSRAGVVHNTPAPVSIWVAARLALQSTAAPSHPRPPHSVGGIEGGAWGRGHYCPPAPAHRSPCPGMALSQRGRAGVVRLLRSQRRAIVWLALASDLHAERRAGQGGAQRRCVPTAASHDLMPIHEVAFALPTGGCLIGDKASVSADPPTPHFVGGRGASAAQERRTRHPNPPSRD